MDVFLGLPFIIAKQSGGMMDQLNESKVHGRFQLLSGAFLLLMGAMVLMAHFVELDWLLHNQWLGVLMYLWFLLDHRMLRSIWRYVYCLFLSSIFFVLNYAFVGVEEGLEMLLVFVALPLSFLVFQLPMRLFYKLLLKREPVTSSFYGKSAGRDFLYILATQLWVLFTVLWMLSLNPPFNG